MQSRIYILASSRWVAYDWAQAHMPFESKKRIQYIHRVETLFGLENPFVVVLPGWDEGKTQGEIDNIWSVVKTRFKKY